MNGGCVIQIKRLLLNAHGPAHLHQRLINHWVWFHHWVWNNYRIVLINRWVWNRHLIVETRQCRVSTVVVAS